MRNHSAFFRSKKPMKTAFFVGVMLIGLVVATGCSDREAEARKAREDAAAKARADAAKKEMDTLPKTFQTPDYFKKNEPEKKTTTATTSAPDQPKPNP